MKIIKNIHISVNLDLNDLIKRIIKKYHVAEDDIKSYEIIKRSLDARKELVYVYSVALDLKNEKKYASLEDYEVTEFDVPEIETEKTVAVVGYGPSGMFISQTLAKAGFNVEVFERGDNLKNRVQKVEQFFKNGELDEESNIQFGEGGAGTFSDGKLNTRTKSPYSKYVLQSLVDCGANEDILYVNNPHVGTDDLRIVVSNFTKKLTAMGVVINYNSLVTNLIVENKEVKGIVVNGENKIYDYVILALGNSSRNTFEKLNELGIDMEAKGFAMGFRIEHLQEKINKSQFKQNYKNEKLGAAEYRLTNNKANTYTFCMCPGGEVVNASSLKDHNVTNGMSNRMREKNNANSSIVVGIKPEQIEGNNPLRGMLFQEEIEKKAYELSGSYQLATQNISDYLKGEVSESFAVKPSSKIGNVSRDLNTLYPKYINDAIKDSLTVFSRRVDCFLDGIIIAAETRTSSPITIVRDRETLMTNVKNLYAIGEGAGYAGGITSSALDGVKVAMKIIEEN